MTPEHRQHLDDIAVVTFFLLWAEKDNAMYGSHQAKHAVAAYARQLGLSPDDLRSMLHQEGI